MSAAIQAARAADREWFEAHPERHARVRELVPGELAGAEAWHGDGLRIAIIFKLEPGLLFIAAGYVDRMPDDSEGEAVRLAMEVAEGTALIAKGQVQ